MSNVARPSMYVLFGSPGAGKGTFAKMVDSNVDHLSVGDIMRNEIAQGTEIGKKYQDVIQSHAVGIPPEVIKNLFKEKIGKSIAAGRGVVIDGYGSEPRHFQDLDSLIEELGLKNRVAFIFIKVDPAVANQRIGFRQVCEKCSAIYNSQSVRPQVADQCDKCNGKLSKRVDDSADSSRRLQKFGEKSKNIFAHFGNRLIELDGNRSPEDCVEDFFKLYQARMAKGITPAHWTVIGISLAFLFCRFLDRSKV